MSDLESCTPLNLFASEAASSPAAFSFAEALLEKLQGIVPRDDAPLVGIQHFDIAGDSDEDEAEEQYFPTASIFVDKVDSDNGCRQEEEEDHERGDDPERAQEPGLAPAQQVSPVTPASQLAPLPQFSPAPRQQAFVVTQPQPPSAPHKRMLEAVECRSKELCGSDLLSAEQARICPEVC